MTSLVVRTRTQTLIGRQLGVPLATRIGGAYRDSAGTPLEGDWLGAFAQPGAILHKASAMSATFSDTSGAIVDEYGNSRVTIVRQDRDRVELVKTYSNGQTYRYVGELRDGTFAGYWCSPLNPAFGGVFWLARVDWLDDATAEALRRRVRSTSPRRALLVTTSAVVAAAFVVGLVAYRPVAFAAGALGALFVSRVNRSSRLLRAEVDAWRLALRA